MRFIAGAFCVLLLLCIAIVTYIYSGEFDVAASTQHGALEAWALNTAMKQSVARRAASIGQPPVFTHEMVHEGFEHFDEMCTGCHGGPGIERNEIGKGLNPQAPDLSQVAKAWSPAQLFWIVKNGVKMTGMPSFGATHDDGELWDIVAFLDTLAGLTAEQYQNMRQHVSAERHEHGHPRD